MGWSSLAAAPERRKRASGPDGRIGTNPSAKDACHEGRAQWLPTG
jgi:hypothetical protein